MKKLVVSFFILLSFFLLHTTNSVEAQTTTNCNQYTAQWRVDSVITNFNPSTGKSGFVINGNFPNIGQCGWRNIPPNNSPPFLVMIQDQNNGQNLRSFKYADSGMVVSETKITIPATYSYPTASSYGVFVFYCTGTAISEGTCGTNIASASKYPVTITSALDCSPYTSQWRINTVTPNYSGGKVGFTVDGNFPNIGNCGLRSANGNTNAAGLIYVNTFGSNPQSKYYLYPQVTVTETRITIPATNVYSDNPAWRLGIYYCTNAISTAGACTGYSSVFKDNIAIKNPVSKTYNVTAHPVCSNGRTPLGNFRIEWKKWSNLTDAYTAYKTGDSTVQVTLNSSDVSGTDAAYIGLEYQGSGTNLQPTGTPPHANVYYAQWFTTLEWDAKFSIESVPAGSYTVNYLAPDAACSEQTACTTAGGTWQMFPNSCADKCNAGTFCLQAAGYSCNCPTGCWDPQNNRCVPDPTPTVTPASCAAPTNMQFQCGYNGNPNKVQLSWQTNSQKVMFRMDKDPSSWLNPGYRGDYMFGPFPDSFQPINVSPSPAGSNYYGITKLSNTSVVVDIDTATNYGWSIQDYGKSSISGNVECRTDVMVNCPATQTCTCQSGDVCGTTCSFNKYSNMSYANPIKCGLSGGFFSSTLTQDNKNAWCNRAERTKGDANGDNRKDLMDYFYYVGSTSRSLMPRAVNTDFNGNDSIDATDRSIVVKDISLGF